MTSFRARISAIVFSLSTLLGCNRPPEQKTIIRPGFALNVVVTAEGKPVHGARIYYSSDTAGLLVVDEGSKNDRISDWDIYSTQDFAVENKAHCAMTDQDGRCYVELSQPTVAIVLDQRGYCIMRFSEGDALQRAVLIPWASIQVESHLSSGGGCVLTELLPAHPALPQIKIIESRAFHSSTATFDHVGAGRVRISELAARKFPASGDEQVATS